MHTAMIVDDEKWVRSALRCTIEESGMQVYVVKECEDGREALEWLQKNSVDLVLADIRMPILDGLGLIKSLREQGNEQDVILITVHDDFRLAREALRLGVIDYLLKPVQEEDIVACFRKWIERQSLMRTETEPAGKRPAVIDKVIRFIEITPLAKVNLTEAASYVYLTPNYLSYLFKQHMNITFIEYLTAIRIREAKKLLRATYLPIAEIAERLAYTEVAYFSNCFKKETGVSPSEYRSRQTAKMTEPRESAKHDQNQCNHYPAI